LPVAIAAKPGVGHANALTDHKLLEKFAAGGIACMFMSAVVNPMDVIKVRLQTQNQLQAVRLSAQPYAGLFSAGGRIFHEEGVRGLFKGITASMMREASYSSMRTGLYDYFKLLFAPNAKTKDDFLLWQKIAAGASSGVIGASIANPTDLVKIRFQSYTPTNPNPYRHTFQAFYRIWRQEGGFRALYRGVAPTSCRAAVLTGTQLSSYDHTKRLMLRSGYFADNASTHIIASIVCGLITTTATNPFDFVKTRIMADTTRYRSPLDCLVKSFRAEGPSCLFKGWLPNWLRLGPHFLVSLPLTEKIRRMLGADTF